MLRVACVLRSIEVQPTFSPFPLPPLADQASLRSAWAVRGGEGGKKLVRPQWIVAPTQTNTAATAAAAATTNHNQPTNHKPHTNYQ